MRQKATDVQHQPTIVIALAIGKSVKIPARQQHRSAACRTDAGRIVHRETSGPEINGVYHESVIDSRVASSC
jgi:hypothetical protein